MQIIIRVGPAIVLAAMLSGHAGAQTAVPTGKTAPKLPNLPDTSSPPAPKADVGRIIQDAVLPGLDGSAPSVKPNAKRTTGDEDEMDDLDVQRRTAPSDQGDAPLPNLRDVLPKNSTGNLLPLIKKSVANGGSVARTTGDEDEMDDLDVQRRTAPSDQGGTPLPELNAPLSKGKASSSAVGGAVLKTARSVFATDQVITVNYSGMSDSKGNWLTIVPVGTPANKYGEWAWLTGTSGTYKGKLVYEPGVYEVRAFENWPAGSYEVKVLATFEVR